MNHVQTMFNHRTMTKKEKNIIFFIIYLTLYEEEEKENKKKKENIDGKGFGPMFMQSNWNILHKRIMYILVIVHL